MVDSARAHHALLIKEFLKEHGYFDSPHFPFDHVKSLMQGYAKYYHKQKMEERMPNERKPYVIMCRRCLTYNKPDAKECEKCGTKIILTKEEK